MRRVITRFVEDAFSQTRARLTALGPQSIDDIRRAGRATVAFSDDFATAQKAIKDFLFARMYRHRAILPVWKSAGKIVRGLFELFMRRPEALPAEWAEAAKGLDEPALARLIADYVACMTDRYALTQADKHLGADMLAPPQKLQ